METSESSPADVLKKEINRREAFERKSAELEGVNDKLRVENGELREQVQRLRKKLEEMSAKTRSTSLSVSPSSTPEAQRRNIKDPKLKSFQKKRPSSMFAHFSCDDQDVEVHTLRREKKELKDELEETKTKQLNFEAAFQTEFDLRTTMEEKYDSLRERYERLVIESDELRKLLRQHSILIPSPPSLRPPKSKITNDGPMKPPRRNRRSSSLQPQGRPKSETAAVGSRQENYHSYEQLSLDHERETHSDTSTENISVSQNESSFSATQGIVSNTIEGSDGVKSKVTNDIRTANKEDTQHDVSKVETSSSSAGPYQPTRTPTGELRQQQSKSIEDLTKPTVPPSKHHKRSASGSVVYVMNPPVSTKSGTGNQSDVSNGKEVAGITITVSTATETKRDQATGVVSTINSTGPQTSGVVQSNEDKDNENCTQSSHSEHSNIIASSNEAEKEENEMEWELDSLMASSAKQLESAKAFYAQMHAHLKKAQSLDDD